MEIEQKAANLFYSKAIKISHDVELQEQLIKKGGYPLTLFSFNDRELKWHYMKNFLTYRFDIIDGPLFGWRVKPRIEWRKGDVSFILYRPLSREIYNYFFHS